MANYQYTADLIDAALFHAGEPLDGTSDYEDAVLRYLNDIYQQIYIGGCELGPDIQEDWWWLYATHTIFLDAEYDTGSIALTQDSTSATLSTPPSISLAGYWIIPDNTSTPYKVSAHTAATTAVTLDQAYAGDTATAAGFTAFKSDYDLASDTLRLLQPMSVYGANHPFVHQINLAELHEQFPLGDHPSGTPEAFAMVDADTVRFSHHGNTSSGNKLRIDIPYLQRPSALTSPGTNEEPLVPLEYRSLLAKYAAYKVLTNKNDDRAQVYLNEAASRYTAMAEENRRKWKQARKKKGGLDFRPGQTTHRRVQTTSGIDIYH